MLPHDVVCHVCGFLDTRSIVALAAVSKAVRSAARTCAAPDTLFVLVHGTETDRCMSKAWPSIRFVRCNTTQGDRICRSLCCWLPWMREAVESVRVRMDPVVVTSDVWAEVPRLRAEVEDADKQVQQATHHCAQVFDVDVERRGIDIEQFSEMLYNAGLDLERASITKQDREKALARACRGAAKLRHHLAGTKRGWNE